MKPLRYLVAVATAALSLAAHAVGNMADIVIYDRAQNRELPVYWHEGRAYVVGRPGNEYQIGLRNRRGEDLLAVISVDGVNVLSGETAHTQQSGYVLSPWRRVEVRGWRKSLGEIAAFYFTSLGDSYAARTGRPDNVGVIGVALFRRKPQATVAPVEAEPFRESRREKSTADNMTQAPAMEGKRGDLRPPPSPSAAPSAPLGTGHGRREESHVQWVPFERADHPVETITLYYDSYRNLVARGIVSAPLAPRDPHPFPGFVPDPA